MPHSRLMSDAVRPSSVFWLSCCQRPPCVTTTSSRCRSPARMACCVESTVHTLDWQRGFSRRMNNLIIEGEPPSSVTSILSHIHQPEYRTVEIRLTANQSGEEISPPESSLQRTPTERQYKESVIVSGSKQYCVIKSTADLIHQKQIHPTTYIRNRVDRLKETSISSH